MKKGQYSEEKIVAILKEAAQTGNAAEVCRKYGISQRPISGGSRSTRGWKSLK